MKLSEENISGSNLRRSQVSQSPLPGAARCSVETTLGAQFLSQQNTRTTRSNLTPASLGPSVWKEWEDRLEIWEIVRNIWPSWVGRVHPAPALGVDQGRHGPRVGGYNPQHLIWIRRSGKLLLNDFLLLLSYRRAAREVWLEKFLCAGIITNIVMNISSVTLHAR